MSQTGQDEVESEECNKSDIFWNCDQMRTHGVCSLAIDANGPNLPPQQLKVVWCKLLPLPDPSLHVFSYKGMTCKPNTHRPSFHVNMVGLDKSTQRSNSSRYPWGLDAEMVSEDHEFELWLQHALASGLFSDSPKRRKSWSPFKMPQKGIKPWRKSP